MRGSLVFISALALASSACKNRDFNSDGSVKGLDQAAGIEEVDANTISYYCLGSHTRYSIPKVEWAKNKSKVCPSATVYMSEDYCEITSKDPDYYTKYKAPLLCGEDAVEGTCKAITVERYFARSYDGCEQGRDRYNVVFQYKRLDTTYGVPVERK